jgi:hypothetical protein
MKNMKLGFKGIEKIGNPIIYVQDYKPRTSDVIFHKYEECDEYPVDKYFGDILTYKVVGIELPNGKVAVYENHTSKEEIILKNKDEFVKRYFTEAI